MKMNTKEKQIAQGAKRIRKTGIDIIGDAPWGTHFCQFYQTKEDLIDILVPYFKAGLENNEFCMWVTSEPLEVEDAKTALRRQVKNLDNHIKKGQIEILDYSQWYTKSGKFHAEEVLQGWVEKQNQALEKGFSGLRLTGNTFWLGKRDWKKFVDYEEEVNNIIGKYKMLAICTYMLDKCGASELIDVVKNHQFALIRREGEWEFIESSERKKAAEALRQSENKYQTLIENLPQRIFLKDKNSIYVSCNENYARDLKIKPEEIAGKTDYDFYPRELAEKYRADDQRIMRSENIEDIEEKYIQNGRELWVHTVKTAVKDEKGQCVGLLGIFWDITECKRAEEEKNKLLHDLNERVKELNCLYEMAKIVEIPKISLGEIFQKTVDVIPPAWQYPNITCARMTIEGQEFKTPIYKDTKWKQSADIRAHGKKVGVVEVCYLEERTEHDEGPFTKEERNLIEAIAERIGHITERKKAEEALRESEERFSKAFHASPDPMTLSRLSDGLLLEVNDSWEQVLGYSRAESVGTSSVTLGLWRDPAVRQKCLQQLRETGSLRDFETELRRKTGEVRQVILSSEPLEIGSEQCLLTLIRDITERKRAEEEVRKKNEELEAFVYMVSHDLKNPVVSIQGFCSSILKNQRDELNEKTLFYLQRVQANASLMTWLNSPESAG